MYEINNIHPSSIEFNRIIIFAEHRFFGESVVEVEKDEFKYLSSKEAIEDYVRVINYFHLKLKLKKEIEP